MTTPKTAEADTMARRPVRPRAAVIEAADHRADAHGRGHHAVGLGPPWKTCLANTGRVTWNS